MKKIGRNFFYQSLFQVVKIIIPIITIPLVSQALGPEGIGIQNYTNSIAQYFVLFAGLGVTIYGNREVAIAWNKDRKQVSVVFWEIFLYKVIISLVALLLYLMFVYFTGNNIYLYAQSLLIIATLVDVSWFFMGVEDFKKTSLANLTVQLTSFLLIVFFIKKPSDVFLYILIQSGGMLFSQLIVWLFIKEYISFIKVKFTGILSHARGTLQFFIPQVSIMLYTNLNKTILGMTLGTAAVGYFSNSLQLNNVIVTIITTLDIVLLPYMTGLFANNNTKKIIRTMDITLHLQLFFSIPLMFGLLTVFDKLVPWFFGVDFLFLNNVIPLFTPLIVIIPLGMSISRQYLMPVGKIGEYNQSVIIGALINIILNLILLPTIGFFGVIIANIVAELFVTLVRAISFVKNTSYKFRWSRIIVYLVSGFLMCIVTRYLTKDMSPNIVTNLIQVIIAVPIYFMSTTLLKVNPILSFIKEKRGS